MSEASSSSEPRAMRYLRALGWAALASAPILLGTLAIVSANPDLPPTLFTSAAIASWIAGSLAFAASLLRTRRARLARIPIAMSALVVVGFCAFLVWISTAVSRLVPLDARERAELALREDRLVHPHLGFSLPALRLEPSEEIVRESAASGGDAWARAHRIWAWEGEGTEVVVDLSRATRADRTVLRASLENLSAPLERSGHEVHVETRELDGDVEARLSSGGTAIARVALLRQRDRAYRLSITIVTSDPDRWRAWLAQVRTR